ncbi:zinc finger MYM-type protein 1-like protein, partial [Tanacetum coccineum]
FLKDHNDEIRAVTLENAPKNCILTSPMIQKDIIECFAKEIVNCISYRLVMTCSRFKSLKELRGQGYDGASNMRGEFNGLKALILKENESTYYVHCFAHQLQRKDNLRESHKERLVKEIEKGENLNREREKPKSYSCTSRRFKMCGSDHRTVTSLIKMFPEVLKVLHYVEEECDTISNRGTTYGLIKALQEYRAIGFASLLKNVTSFCGKHDIEMVNIESICNDKDFANLDSIVELAEKMVDKKKHTSYPLVYRLLKLALVLPVATAAAERFFSIVKLVKTDLRNRIDDDYFNGALTCAIEKEKLINVKNEGVRKPFFAMGDRRITY